MLNWIVVSIFHLAFANAQDVSCECLNAACNPCEMETGTTFYSAKCGPGLARVKSCKKPTCVPVENQKQCLADLGVGEDKSTPIAKKAEPAAREPASAPAPIEPVGKVVIVIGEVSVTHADGKVEAAQNNMDVFEKDSFETRDAGKAKIVFNEGNDLILMPKTKTAIEMSQFSPETEKGKTIINLLYGKIRSKVRRNYDNKNAYYRVRTPTAVAGVRGTDFVISYEDQSESNKITRVETIDGRVGLSSRATLADGRTPASKDEREIGPGHYGIHTTSIDASGAPKPGLLGPAQKIDADLLRNIDSESNLELVARAMSPIEDGKKVVCSAPSADFKQCAFQCVGNPQGASRCRTDLATVRCVRKVCNANGQWAEESRVPASQGDLCDAQATVVRECGIVW